MTEDSQKNNSMAAWGVYATRFSKRCIHDMKLFTFDATIHDTFH